MIADSIPASGLNVHYVRLFHVLCCEDGDFPQSSHVIRLNRIYKMKDLRKPKLEYSSSAKNNNLQGQALSQGSHWSPTNTIAVHASAEWWTMREQNRKLGDAPWTSGLAGWKGELHDCRQRMWHTWLTLMARRATCSLSRSKYGERKREINTKGRKSEKERKKLVKNAGNKWRKKYILYSLFNDAFTNSNGER